MKNLTRREFISKSIKTGAVLSMLPVIYSCSGSKTSVSFSKKIVILGIDGMDPGLLEQFMKAGLMPNFKRLAESGGFKKLRSSIPPQSPVAWSEFAVGAPASVHGIFDFIHRDPGSMQPYFSTSRVADSENTLSIGNWEIPLTGGAAEQLRKGTPFWEYLGDAGIPATIFKMPGEFPVKKQGVNCVSGMGTPDLLGSYGMFSFYTTKPPANYQEITGGEIFPVKIINNKIETALTGPANSFKKKRPSIKLPFTVYIDPQNEVVKVKIQNHELIMRTGEWSRWIQLSFDYLPLFASVKGICKIYIKQIRPDFEMYISPVNIDPTDQALPVTAPENFGQELVNNAGYFSTKGLPADTKALSYGVLSDNEYLQTSNDILEESKRILNYELEKLKARTSGLLFYYFSNLDQDSHMFWRAIENDNPLYTKRLGSEFSGVIKQLYIEMDKILGGISKSFNINDKNFRLIILSDHGFAPFNRCVNLNTWLFKNNYVSFYNGRFKEGGKFFQNVDWAKTEAYGLGINSLYINKKGREKYGIVPESESERLMEKIRKELLLLEDPASGEKAVSNIWLGKEIYGHNDNTTPDMIIGWNRGFRASWETILGEFTRDVFSDNTDKWSGDHCIDPAHVPAVLLSNRRIENENPSLPDVTATILAECGIPIPGHITGKPIYEI